jgi:large subunit ribosomal protein L18e
MRFQEEHEMKSIEKKTNPRLVQLITLLKDTSRENEVNIWREIASRLETPSRNYAEVNLSKINRYANEGETILVPGKVLGSGVLEAAVNVAALNFSESAACKIRDARGQCMTIEELLRNNPKGSRIRILR